MSTLHIISETSVLHAVAMSLKGIPSVAELNSEQRLLKHHYNTGLQELIKHTLDHPESGMYDHNVLRSQLVGIQQALLTHGVTVITIEPKTEEAILQFFMRDIGFVIGDRFYIARPWQYFRQQELPAIGELAHTFPIENVYHCEEEKAKIEGGDIIVQGTTVYIGITRQTNTQGALWLKKHLPAHYNVIEIPCNDTVLHLDCRFNIIDEHTCVLDTRGLRPEGIEKITQQFSTVIEVSKEEQVYIATNFLMLAPEKALIDERCVNLIKTLEQRHITCHTLPMDEITKLWGNVRCCVMPLARK